jgi:DNA adenine methylase
MLPLISAILQQNNLAYAPYVEAFAGGCGLALGLLFEGFVSEIHINDIDPGIWSFWHAALEHSDDLCARVRAADLSVAEWRTQREVFRTSDLSDPVALGFAAFYLNRTNRSGIIEGAGVIGGLDQSGNYKMDCRFNKDDLIQRILRVKRYRGQITLTRLDAGVFLEGADLTVPKRAMFCIDPPYFHKGSSLYTSFYRASDHAVLAQQILKLERPWVVTYDNTPEIDELYRSRARYTFDVNYSVQTKRMSSELLIASPELILPFALDARKIA